jgi:hypothetical protein
MSLLLFSECYYRRSINIQSAGDGSAASIYNMHNILVTWRKEMPIISLKIVYNVS